MPEHRLQRTRAAYGDDVCVQTGRHTDEAMYAFDFVARHVELLGYRCRRCGRRTAAPGSERLEPE